MSMSPLYQPVHILRKDARHLWPETLVSIALLIAFAWAEVQTWAPSDGTFNPAGLALGILRFLIPVSWLVLTSRLVHDEELVGDRQFWTTRPYTWYSLLAAKILYLVVFISVPFLIMQAWLLHHAGLYPTLLLPALLKNQLYIAAIFLLPLVAIAAVTSTFVRYISSVLGGFIYLFAVVAIAAYVWSDKLDAPYLGSYLAGALIVLVLAALILQYATRKTLIARLMLVAVPLVIVLFAALSPVNALNNHRYPDSAPGTASFDTDPVRQQPDGRLFTFQHKVALDLPIQLQLPGLSADSYLLATHFRTTLDGPNGFHYASDWTGETASFSPQQSAYVLPLLLPEKIYNKIHDQPVSLHIELGTQTFNPGTPYSITATEKPFPIPHHAACTVSSDDGVLECRFAFANPDLQKVEATVHPGNCLTPGPQSATGVTGMAPSLTSFGFSPVEILRPQMTLRTTKVSVCPGTRTTFTPSVPGPYGRLHLDIPSIKLDPYARRIPTRPDTPTPDPTQAPQQ
jgi:hypothetical protein